MNLQIVLLRHATRSAVLEFGSGESALNAVGLAQAEDLVKAVQPKGALPAPTHIFTSPKLRARQTLAPLAKSLSIEPVVLADLDERRDNESLSSFERRVRDITEKIKTERGVVYLCTHLDVLEAAAALWPTDFTEREQAQPWSTLEYQLFTVTEGRLDAGLRGRVETR